MRFVKIELILVLMLDTFPLIGFRTLSSREFWKDTWGLRSNVSVAVCLVSLFLGPHLLLGMSWLFCVIVFLWGGVCVCMRVYA